MLHLAVGDKGKLATLDNALSHFSAFTSTRLQAISIIRRVWGEVREWKTTFETCGANGKLLSQIEGAFRKLEHIASPELVNEIRKGA
jgi:serine/threonine-protein kinase HipA